MERINLGTAARFLTLLDPHAKALTFQTFADKKGGSGGPALARIYHASLEEIGEELRTLNQRGAGIFVTVNETDGKGRKAANIIRVRAVWQDDDKAWYGDFPLPPSIEVRTSPGKYQRYWLVQGLSLDAQQGIMARLVADFGSDPGARDVARVLRVPGFLHCKGDPHPVELIGGTGEIIQAQELCAAFPPMPQEVSEPRVPIKNGLGAEDDDAMRVLMALANIPADDRENWWRIGAALKAEFGDGARALWDGWSATSAKFDVRAQNKAWRSFKRTNGLRLGTIFHLAKQYGGNVRGGLYA